MSRPGGRGPGGGVVLNPGGDRCTSDLLYDSAWTPLDLEGAPTMSVMDRHEVSFRARGLFGNPLGKSRYIRRTKLHPLPEALHGTSRVLMDIVYDISLLKQI